MTDLHTQTVLVTGAAGFIGSHVCDHLLAGGARVVGIDNFCDFYDPAIKRQHIAAAQQHARFTLHKADIRENAQVRTIFANEKPTAVIHLAAMAGVRPSIEQPALYTEVNLTGTTNVLEAAVETGVAKLLFASSSSVYGNNTKVPFAEDDRVDTPISPYAATKRAGELLCHTFSHLYDLPIACLRFFTVYGPRQRPDLAISKFMRLAANDEPIPVFGDGSTSRDYTYIDDIVAGVFAALERTGDTLKGCGIYNLGGSSPVQLCELLDAIAHATGKTLQLDCKPMQPGDVERTFADLTKSSEALGYTPKTMLAEGLAKHWAWLQHTLAS